MAVDPNDPNQGSQAPADDSSLQDYLMKRTTPNAQAPNTQVDPMAQAQPVQPPDTSGASTTQIPQAPGYGTPGDGSPQPGDPGTGIRDTSNDPVNGTAADMVSQVPAAGAPAAPTAGAPITAKAGSQDWINQQLAAVQSTDDPAYWAKVIAADPKVAAGDASAAAYWVDRIRRGDGSALVKNGSLQKVQDGGSGGGNFGTGGGAFGSAQAGSLYNLLMDRATQSLNVNSRDPIIANQVGAYDANQQRSRDNYLRQAAEQAGPQGNLAQEKRMTAEEAARNTGGFQGQLMQQELTARRAEIQNALNGAQGMMSDQQRMALQQQLAQMDNALSYARLNQDAYQFDANDEFRRSPLAQ